MARKSMLPPRTQVAAPFKLDPGNRGVRGIKAELRVDLAHRRRIITADLQDTTRWKTANNLRALLAELGPCVVALYQPMAGEVDLTSLADDLRRQNFAVALPRVVLRGHPLTFNLWPQGEPLEPDALGIPAATGPEISPAVIVLPMLGYNRKGYRLGYGGGFYDQTLKALTIPATTIGVCHTELEIFDFPSEYHDIRLSYIVTGKETITCQ